MDHSTTQLNAQKIGNPNEFDWLYHEELSFQTSDKALQLPPLEDANLYQFFSLPPYLTYHLPSAHMDSDDFGGDIFFPLIGTVHFDQSLLVFDDACMFMANVEKPVFTSTATSTVNAGGDVDLHEGVSRMIEQGLISRSSKNTVIGEDGDNEDENEVIVEEMRKSIKSGRKRSAVLELEEIQKYFDVPITRAAKELNVGLTVLKKRCRQLNIMRWPQRKIKSLDSLIRNVKEMGLNNEIMLLEEHKKVLSQIPNMDLTERTKRLRQACFKANYNKKKELHHHHHHHQI